MENERGADGWSTQSSGEFSSRGVEAEAGRPRGHRTPASTKVFGGVQADRVRGVVTRREAGEAL